MRRHKHSVGLSFKLAQSDLPSYFIHQILYYWKSLVVVIEEAASRCASTADWTQHPVISREQIIWEHWVITLPLCCLPHKQDVGSKQCDKPQCWAKKQARYSNCKHRSASGYLGNEEAFAGAQLRIGLISDVCNCFWFLNYFWSQLLSWYWGWPFLMQANDTAP